MSQIIVTIDGNKIRDFGSFIQEFNQVYSQFDVCWNGNLDAFNDYLSWPDVKYTLIWRHSSLSREKLGYEEMIKWLDQEAQHCHPSNMLHIQQQLEAAKLGKSNTMFDLLVDIILSNSDYIQLWLE